MRRPNHASRFEGIAKTNLQASSASDTETLQSQVDKAGKKRLSLSGLEILHGRLSILYSDNCSRTRAAAHARDRDYRGGEAEKMAARRSNIFLPLKNIPWSVFSNIPATGYEGVRG